MKTKNCIFLGLILFILTISSCSNDEKMASIVGKWNGNKAEFDLKPFMFPYTATQTDNHFDTVVEFKNDGALTLVRNGQSLSGTYEVKDNKLISNNIHIKTHLIAFSGSYTIKELTDSKLVIYVERNDTFQDPDTGTNIRGTVKATLYFARMQN